MRTIGRSFRTFKNHLVVNHIIPFKDQPEMLKKPRLNIVSLRMKIGISLSKIGYLMHFK